MNKWYDEWNDEMNDENEICWNQKPFTPAAVRTCDRNTGKQILGGQKNWQDILIGEQKDWSSNDEDPVLIMFSKKSRDKEGEFHLLKEELKLYFYRISLGCRLDSLTHLFRCLRLIWGDRKATNKRLLNPQQSLAVW